MSHFNGTANSNQTYEGGEATPKSLEQEWTNMIFSSFLQDGFYETKEQYTARMMQLNNAIINKYGANFATHALDYVRNTLGMRTTASLLAAQLNGHQFEGKRNAFANYFRRPDDISETFAAIDEIGGKRSHALIRGASDYLSNLSDYTLGKYKMKGHTYNMFDLINLTHAHSKTIDKYKSGELKAPDTWEVRISTAKDADDRAKNWYDLVVGNKLGYLALLRNLRNIIGVMSYQDIKDYLVPQIVNKEAIKKSLVFPYQIYNAYKAIAVGEDTSWYDYEEWYEEQYSPSSFYEDSVEESKSKDLLVNALNNAFIYSIENVPALDGKNCVILDVSGSMSSPWSPTLSIIEVSAVYATAIILKNIENSQIIKFASEAKVVDPVKDFENINTVFDIIYLLAKGDNIGYGTNLDKVTPFLDNYYDSIFLFSDMQVMESDGYMPYREVSYFRDYCKHNPNTPIFSFDLGNYHQRVKTGLDNIYPITTLSPNVFDFISLVKEGKTLIDVINEAYSK